MIRQCAWCRSFILKGLRISSPLPVSNHYSHGICITCKNELLGRKEERYPQKGRLVAIGSAI